MGWIRKATSVGTLGGVSYRSGGEKAAGWALASVVEQRRQSMLQHDMAFGITKIAPPPRAFSIESGSVKAGRDAAAQRFRFLYGAMSLASAEAYLEMLRAAQRPIVYQVSATPVGGPAGPATVPGWYADPQGRFECRWHDGWDWTGRVFTAGHVSHDTAAAELPG